MLIVSKVTVFIDYYAIDTDSIDEAKELALEGYIPEFSQKCDSTTIAGVAEATEDEYLAIFDELEPKFSSSITKERKLAYIHKKS